jgi:hypothetical protein
MANITSFEGYSSTLARWETENTALLSEGHDKRSNLENSITLSLRSPRISSSPAAQNLISLLSLLPDGITPEDIIVGKVPISHARQCQSVLLSTSLAYIDVKGRLKALTPFREYIRRACPPSASITRPLRTYFQELLEVWQFHRELPSGNLAPDLVSHLGNINQLILAGLLTEGKSAWIELGESIITLENFSAKMMKGSSPLFKRLPRLIEETDNAALQWKYRGRILRNIYDASIKDWIQEGVQYFNAGRAPVAEGELILSLTYLALIARNPAVNFYNAVAYYYTLPKYWNISKATNGPLILPTELMILTCNWRLWTLNSILHILQFTLDDRSRAHS